MLLSVDNAACCRAAADFTVLLVGEITSGVSSSVSLSLRLAITACVIRWVKGESTLMYEVKFAVPPTTLTQHGGVCCVCILHWTQFRAVFWKHFFGPNTVSQSDYRNCSLSSDCTECNSDGSEFHIVLLTPWLLLVRFANGSPTPILARLICIACVCLLVLCEIACLLSFSFPS